MLTKIIAAEVGGLIVVCTIGGIIMALFSHKKAKPTPTCLISSENCMYPDAESCEKCYVRQAQENQELNGEKKS